MAVMKYIFVADPAIDVEATSAATLREYTTTRDISLLKLRDNRAPTVYHLRDLTDAEMEYVEQVEDNQRWWRAFRLAVVKVENLSYGDEVRPVLEPTSECVSTRAGKRVAWTEEELDKLFPRAAKMDVGYVAWWRSFLGQGTGLVYPQQRISLELLMTQFQRRAAERQAMSTPSSDEPTSP